MRLRQAAAALLAALCCADGVLARGVLHMRQDTTDVASTSPTPTDTTTSNTSPTSNTQTTDSAKDTTTTGDKTTNAGPTHVITTSAPSGTIEAGGQNATKHKEDELPIQPTITPAIGLAGVILLCTGIAYTIIGIKHKWLLVFLSAAYLASLSITVLIIYVMSPPVSDAIQGAYFVAAFMTGVIFGGISLVFKEVTEGFGCIVGGFCIAMWFLVLKPGGLIASSTGRAIMIGVFCAVGWSLAFSQYTRTYGTIICTSFGGAMITMIGIDCFSRAGLKEFWIYIWALNDKEFPIHTSTYPITRGIRVEIAGTVVLFLFGIMSQIKVWKIVRERKLKNEAVRLRDDQRREDRDSKIGKRVEKNNERSLARWEQIYGDAKVTEDSAYGTESKQSGSIRERELDSIEMDDMSTMTGNRNSKDVRTSVMEVLPEDHVSPSRAPELQLEGMEGGSGDDYGWWNDFRSTKAQSHVRSAPSVDQSSLAEMLPGHAGPPPIGMAMSTPPKSVVDEQQSQQSETEKSVHERRGVPLDKLGLKKLNEQRPAALPRIEDDRASSIAATLDEEPEFDPKRLSVAPSNYQAESEKGGLSPFSDEFKVEDKLVSPARTPVSQGEKPILEEEDDEALVRPAAPAAPADTEAGADRPKSLKSKKSTKSKKRMSKSSVASNDRDIGNEDEDADSESDEKAPSVHSLKASNLPESISKIAMAYRTNEWAKHIADANQPDIEEEPQGEVEEDSVQIEYQRPAKEKPKPVETSALLETGAPERRSPKVGSGNGTNPFRQGSKESSGSTKQKERRRSSGATPTPVYAFNRQNSNQSLNQQPSAASLQRQTSNTSLQIPKMERKVSQPLSQHSVIVESPIEDAASSHYETPLGSTANLLDDRNNRLQKRMTTTSFNALNVPASNEPYISEGEDNVPLSQRKELLEQGLISPSKSRQTLRQSSTPLPSQPAPSPTPGPSLARTTSQNLIYDSHQPRRANTVDTKKQSALLTQWRQSLQQENNPNPNSMAEEQARMQMIMNQRQSEHQARKKEKERERRESERDVAMRTSMLAGAHQDAMRRMQAKANANAK